jgi:hypothetical protein
LLDKIVLQQYKIKALAQNQVRIQPKTPDAYRAIIKALTEKNTSFYTFKSKEERSYKVVLKNMHFSITYNLKSNDEDTLLQTSTTSNTVSPRPPLTMFFVDLKPAPNNKEIFRIEYLQQCKIKFETPITKETFPNAPIAKVMATRKTSAIKNPDVSNVPVPT